MPSCTLLQNVVPIRQLRYNTPAGFPSREYLPHNNYIKCNHNLYARQTPIRGSLHVIPYQITTPPITHSRKALAKHILIYLLVLRRYGIWESTHTGKHTNWMPASWQRWTFHPNTREHLKALLCNPPPWRIAIWFVTCWHQQQTQAMVSNSTSCYIACKALPSGMFLVWPCLAFIYCFGNYTAYACCYACTTRALTRSYLVPRSAILSVVCFRSQATRCIEPTTTVTWSLRGEQSYPGSSLLRK